MPRFQCDPNIEVIGQQAIAYVNNIRSTEIRPALTKYGLATINPTAWYPLQNLLDVLGDLAEKPDWSSNFVSIGLAMADTVPMPDEGTPIEDFFQHINDAYQAGHRGGDTGMFEVRKVDDQHFLLVNEIKTAYPDDVVYGLIYGIVRRILPKGTSITVRYDESNGPRRDNGGDFTVLDIVWS